jgi:hypothetical protein
MPTPPECQPIADGIADLAVQEQKQRDALPGLSGVDKWKAMETLGTLRVRSPSSRPSSRSASKITLTI